MWEEYAGWFQHASTIELYGVPTSAVWSEVASLAGGAAALAERGKIRLGNGEPIEALHLVEMALAYEPKNRGALQVQLAAYEALAHANGGADFDELGWQIAYVTTNLDEALHRLDKAYGLDRFYAMNIVDNPSHPNQPALKLALVRAAGTEFEVIEPASTIC